MKANNTTGEVKVYHFTATKFNKQDTTFTGKVENPNTSFIPSQVRIERFQGYSKAYNLGLYFKIRNNTNWARCEKVTGLWKSSRKGFYYGDRRTPETKTLLLFSLDENHEYLTVFEYPNGYYPSKSVIEKLIQNL
jgi:hypothetical protein